jgi:hypothetical protein
MRNVFGRKTSLERRVFFSWFFRTTMCQRMPGCDRQHPAARWVSYGSWLLNTLMGQEALSGTPHDRDFRSDQRDLLRYSSMMLRAYEAT